MWTWPSPSHKCEIRIFSTHGDHDDIMLWFNFECEVKDTHLHTNVDQGSFTHSYIVKKSYHDASFQRYSAIMITFILSNWKQNSHVAWSRWNIKFSQPNSWWGFGPCWGCCQIMMSLGNKNILTRTWATIWCLEVDFVFGVLTSQYFLVPKWTLDFLGHAHQP